MVAESAGVGKSRRTRISFICGRDEVATASSVGSVGQRAMEDGEKGIQAFEWGARFWVPMRRSSWPPNEGGSEISSRAWSW